MNLTKTTIWIAGGAVILLCVFFALFFLLRSSASPTPSTSGTSFGTATSNTTAVSSDTNTTSSSDTNQTVPISGNSSNKKVFELAQGPIVSATFIQTFHPTTTLVRYIMQENGHVYDLPVDVAGAVPRVVSNVTIPGGVRALWAQGGSATLLQYLDGSTVKTVYLGFPASSTLPTKIQFLPDNIGDLALSPDGKSVAYFLKTTAGSDGYIAKNDGTGAKKLFSLPLSQVLMSWPSQGTILAESKSASGVPGIIFSIDAKSGAVSPLVYAQGVTASANPTFSQLIYQMSDGSNARSYIHTVKNGVDTAISFDPIPEKCLWSILSTSSMYCAVPLAYTGPTYLDLWHVGTASAADSVLSFNTTNGKTSILTTPGGNDGGVQSDIIQMTLSSDEHYLAFVRKGDRALWGVRLTP